jgi:fatty-acid desaturase
MHDKLIAPVAPQPGLLRRIKWVYALPIVSVHLIAALALLPWFFSWTGVVLVPLVAYVFGVLGINIGHHRLLAHRGFSCPRWVERTLIILGVCCMQDSPTVWVAQHRQHHHMADRERDPHSPAASFLWGHVGWLVIRRENAEPGPSVERYAGDLLSDPFYEWLERGGNWAKIATLSWAAFFAAGFAAVALTGGAMPDAVRFGSSLLVWGAAVRTVLVWHVTWSVNSVTHLWGYRTYETPDNSRNNFLIGWLAYGEGWHNNHHADPRAARHGHSWREPDGAWLTIRALQAVGLAWDVAVSSPRLRDAAAAPASRASQADARRDHSMAERLQ